MAWDKEGNMFVSDTSTGRVTGFVKPLAGSGTY